MTDHPNPCRHEKQRQRAEDPGGERADQISEPGHEPQGQHQEDHAQNRAGNGQRQGPRQGLAGQLRGENDEQGMDHRRLLRGMGQG